MADKQPRSTTYMTAAEYRRGGLLFALYLLVFPVLVGVFQRWLGGDFTAAECSLIYYSGLALLLVLLFRQWLRYNFHWMLARPWVNLSALGGGLAAALALTFLVRQLPFPVADPALTNCRMQHLMAPRATVAVFVLLMPLVEEIFFRGVLFGGLRRRHRKVGLVLSAAGYALYCVWQFALTGGGAYLLLAACYLPLGAAAVWCHDRTGSVWTAVFLHMLYNGAVLYAVL